jgi:hypothetical protein
MWIILLSGFLYICATGEEYFDDVLGLLTALVLAIAGLLFYARMGIDEPVTGSSSQAQALENNRVETQP